MTPEEYYAREENLRLRSSVATATMHATMGILAALIEDRKKERADTFPTVDELPEQLRNQSIDEMEMHHLRDIADAMNRAHRSYHGIGLAPEPEGIRSSFGRLIKFDIGKTNRWIVVDD